MSVQETIKIDRVSTIPAAFFRSAELNKDRIAYRAHGGRGRSFAYREVADLVFRLSKGLQAANLIHHPEIGLLSENRPEWPIAYLAILTAGGTVVPIDANLKEQEIGYIVGHAHLDTIICSGRFETLLKKLPGNLRTISFEDGSVDSWNNVFDTTDTTTPKTKEAGSDSHIAALIYTSGTTGAPKAVELTHRNLLANLEGISASLSFDHHDVFLSVLPLHHTFEATCGFLTPLMSGSAVVFARSLKSKELLEDIAHNGATIMCGVPLLFEKMYHTVMRKIITASTNERVMFRTLYAASSVGWSIGLKTGKIVFRRMRKKSGLGSIRMFVSGGAAIPPRIARFFNLIGFDFMQGFGLTETSPVVAVNRPDDIRFGSVGAPLKGVEVTIINPNTNGIGEILVRGDNVTPGYRDNPEATAELLQDGWLHTGDLGKIRDGHLWITGRKKNLIVSAAGKNIYPEELEEQLVESLFVLEAVVFGRAKKHKQGEAVCALIVPDMDQMKLAYDISTTSPDMLKIGEVIDGVVKSVNAQLSDFKRISSFDVRLQELEKTSTKKVKRFLYT